MMDYFVSLLLKAAESFTAPTLASKLAERLAAPKDAETRKKPSPRRSKQKG